MININMRFVEILREYNEQRLIHDFGNKLIKHWLIDSHSEPDYNIANFERHPWFNDENIQKRIVEKISALDPTPNKELTFWLVNNYANNRISRFEDISSRAVPALLKFKALLRKPNLNPPLPVRDINQIKGLPALENIIEKYPDELTETDKEKEQEFYNSKQADLLYNSDTLKVIIPRTEEASCYFGRGTRWCTAATNNNMFHSYYEKDDPLYIVYIKGTNEKYQFHFGSEQFMDEKDQEIDTFELTEKYPELEKIFAPISAKNKQLYFNNHPTEKLQIAVVSRIPSIIDSIKNPSEKVQLAAVSNNGYAIRWIKNPSEKVQLAAVANAPLSIKYLENPTQKVILLSQELIK